MQEQINQHLKTIRLGAIAQEERRQTAIELSEILGSEALKTAAIQLQLRKSKPHKFSWGLICNQ